MISKEYPSLRDRLNYDAFVKKWQYLFAYAGAGFAKGYITCHMLTFIRQVRTSVSQIYLLKLTVTRLIY